MTYLTQNDIANDRTMLNRVAQASAQEGITDENIDPDLWTYEWRRVWAAAPGWDDAWESALAGDPPHENPGSDPAVITDEQILSQVQAMKPFKQVAR